MRYVLLKRGQKCATMKTDAKFENTSDSFVKFYPAIRKHDEKMRKLSRMEILLKSDPNGINIEN